MKSFGIINPLSIIWIVITFIEYLWIDSMSLSNDKLTEFSVMLVINLTLQMGTLYIKRVPLYSFFPVFIIFYYVFHFGQVFLIGFFPKYEMDYLNYVESYMTNDDYFRQTLILCVVCINMFFAGGMMMRYKAPKVYSEIVKVNARNVGKFLFFIFFPLRLAIDGIQVVAAMVGGYMASITVTEAIPGVLATLANIWYACIPLYYLELKTNKQKKIFLLVVLLYLLTTMITGNRGHQMVCILSLFIVVIIEQKTFSLKQIILSGIVAVFGMYFIDVIYDLRNVGVNDFFKDYTSMVQGTKESNIFLETLGTFGETIYTPYLVIEGCNTSLHPFFGECFIKSFISVIPDVFGTFKEINKEAVFPKMLELKSAIGGSFAGEMYYNFASLYWLMSLLIGMLFFNVSNIITLEIRKGNYFKLLLLIPFAVLFVWWVRDAIGNFTRQIVWLGIIIYFFKSKKLIVFNRLKLTK